MNRSMTAIPMATDAIQSKEQLMDERGPIEVTTAVKFKRWQVPKYASQDMSPRPRQDGMVPLPTMRVSELPHQVLDALAEAWLVDLWRCSI